MFHIIQLQINTAHYYSFYMVILEIYHTISNTNMAPDFHI